MDTQDLDSGSVDPVETSTTSLDSIVPATPASEDEFDEESHDICGTRYLFSRWSHYCGEIDTTISELRLGAAAGCYNCGIVLDAVASYDRGWLSRCSVITLVKKSGTSIRLCSPPALDSVEESSQSRPREVELELFHLERKSCIRMTISLRSER